MVGQRIGYVRVSTVEQNADRQLEGVELERIFTDRPSGKDAERPEQQSLMTFVRQDDTVVVHSMDRLARNLDDLRRIVQVLTGRGIRIEFVKEQLVFTGEDSPMATLLLSVMGAFAEFERELLRERQREGIAIAKAKGVYRGRRKTLSPEAVEQLQPRAALREARAQLAREFGISRETVYQYLRLAQVGESTGGI